MHEIGAKGIPNCCASSLSPSCPRAGEQEGKKIKIKKKIVGKNGVGKRRRRKLRERKGERRGQQQGAKKKESGKGKEGSKGKITLFLLGQKAQELPWPVLVATGAELCLPSPAGCWHQLCSAWLSVPPMSHSSWGRVEANTFH